MRCRAGRFAAGTHHVVARAALAGRQARPLREASGHHLQDAFDLVEIRRRAERILMVSQNYRYNAPFRAVQRLVMEGDLEELASIKISCRRDTRAQFSPTISGTPCATLMSSTCLSTTSTS